MLRPAGALTADGQGPTPWPEIDRASVDVAEIHDCFSVMGAIGVEVLGKAAPGGGAGTGAKASAAVDGDCAINTSGGLIAKGHPIGATGIAMLGWSFLAAPRQGARPHCRRRDARVAATFNIGGPVCASCLHGSQTATEPPR